MLSWLLIALIAFSFWINCAPAQFAEPSFPDTFSTFVEADFIDNNKEGDVEIYFDRKNNRAAVHFFSQNVMFIQIYWFDKDIFISIEDSVKCDVSNISSNPDEPFFPYEVDSRTNKKKLLSAREFFRFPSPAPKPADVEDGIPMYIYSVTSDLKFWNRKECDIKYMFTKNFAKADCDKDICKPTILGINVNCPSFEDDDGYVQQLYRFFKFEDHIPDETVFEIPAGLHCDLPQTKPFPKFPNTFNFAYEVREKELDIEEQALKMRLNRKAITYMENETLVVDKYEESTLVNRSICDLSHGIGYNINVNTMECERASCAAELDYRKASQLPEILFPCKSCGSNNTIVQTPVYVGNRSTENLWYDVWSSYELVNSLHVIRDMYFTQNLLKTDVESPSDRLSHIIEYVYSYVEDEDTGQRKYQLLKNTFTYMHHFSFTRDWATFSLDVCYPATQKKHFELQLSDSPSIVEGSLLYRKVLRALTTEILNVTGLPATRLTELKVIPGPKKLTLKGAILENPAKLGWTVSTKAEPSMTEAFSIIKKRVQSKNLAFNVPISNNDRYIFKVESFQEPDYDSDDGAVYSKGAMAGLGIAMSLIGALIGSIAILVYLKSRSK